MRNRLCNKRLIRLIEIIDLRLNNSISPLDSDITLFYPDENKTRLPDSEVAALMESIEGYFENSDSGAFTALLNAFMVQKKMKTHKLYTAALIEKSYFYQILSGKYVPSRDTTIRIVVALKLSSDESKQLLQTFGYSFFEKSRRDIIIMACVEHRAGLYTTELLLDKYGEASLCNKSILLTE